jgi:hypothetical protein
MSSFYTLHEWDNTDKRLVIFTAPGTLTLEPAALRPGHFVTVKSQIATILTAPTQTATATATTGGTLAAGTYYYKVTALNANGESLGSNEESQVTTGSTSTVTVSWGSVTGATSYRVYRGTAAGAENVYYTVNSGVTYTDTGAASTAGTPPTVAGAVIAGSGSDTIDGNASITLSTNYDYVELFTDGKHWNIVARTPASNAS